MDSTTDTQRFAVGTKARGAMHLAIAAVLACPAAFAADTPPGSSLDYRHDLAHKLQQGDSPRDWALGAQLLETQPPSGAALRERVAILRKASQAAPRDRMVQALWAGIALDGSCKARMGCGDASALARIEPDNGASWLPVVDEAVHGGRAAAINAAIEHMAGSSRYNEHFGEAITAWRDVFQRFPPPPRSPAEALGDGGYVLDIAFSEAAATADPAPGSPLIDACSRARHPDAGARRFESCAHIGRIMMGRSQTLLGRVYGVAILRASHAGTAADVKRVRTVMWQNEQIGAISDTLGNDPVAKQNYMNLIQSNDSEIAALQYELALFGVAPMPPPGWKQTRDGKQVEPLDDLLPAKP